MTRRHNLWMLGSVAIVVLAVVLLAAGLDSVVLKPGRPFSWGRVDEMRRGVNPPLATDGTPLETFARVVMTTMMILLPFALVAVLASREARWRLIKLVGRWTVFVVLIYLIAQLVPTTGETISMTPCPGTQSVMPLSEAAATAVAQSGCAEPGIVEQPPVPQTPGFVSQPPEWAVGLVSLVLAAALLAVAWWIFRRRRALPAEAEAEQLAAEAEVTLADLRAGGDLRDAVTRCYSEMSELIGQQRGLARHGSMTPREFEHFLMSAGLRDEHIQRLTRLFEAVRYGGRATGERDRREAIDCLAAIVRDHGRPA